MATTLECSVGESRIQESVKLIFGFLHFKPERIARGFRLEGLKGTVARDLWPLVYFMNRPHTDT